MWQSPLANEIVQICRLVFNPKQTFYIRKKEIGKWNRNLDGDGFSSRALELQLCSPQGDYLQSLHILFSASISISISCMFSCPPRYLLFELYNISTVLYIYLCDSHFIYVCLFLYNGFLVFTNGMDWNKIFYFILFFSFFHSTSVAF